MSRPVAPVEELLGEQSRVEFKADNTDPGKIRIRISALSNAVRLADRQGHLLNPETVLKVRLKFESLPVKFSRGVQGMVSIRSTVRQVPDSRDRIDPAPLNILTLPVAMRTLPGRIADSLTGGRRDDPGQPKRRTPNPFRRKFRISLHRPQIIDVGLTESKMPNSVKLGSATQAKFSRDRIIPRRQDRKDKCQKSDTRHSAPTR